MCVRAERERERQRQRERESDIEYIMRDTMRDVCLCTHLVVVVLSYFIGVFSGIRSS